MTATPEQNVVSHLERAARTVPDRPALVMPGGARVSFADLWERVDRVSVGLARAGLRPGARTVLMVPMSVELYVVMLAVLKRGAVGVFVDPWIGRKQIAAFSAFAAPAAWIGITKSHLLRLRHDELRRIPLAITTGMRLGPWPARHTLRRLATAQGDGRIHPVSLQDPGLVTFTTGSSGTPKGANRTHGFLGAQHEALKAEFPYDEHDVDMPMFPVFALNNLATGITSVVPDMDFARVAEVDPRTILRQMRREGVTTATASPPFFDRLARADDLPPLRRILSGGAPVSDRQLRAWHAAFPATEIQVVYGSTEAEPVAHISAQARLAATLSTKRAAPGFCAGRPTSRVRTRVIRIHDGPIELGDDGWPAWDVPAGDVGELVVAGEHIGRDYYRNPEAGAENKILDADGTVWHRMGDTGYFDAEGRFWLVGRVHSTMRRDGCDVHPQLVEQAALGDGEGILRVAAVGLPDARLGQRVVVAVEAASSGTLAADVAARVHAAGLPCDEVYVTPVALPVDPRHNSKVDYRALEARLRERAPAS